MDPEAEEYELALQARAGDREALAELVERTRLRLFGLAYAELRHYDDAHDAVASALLQICLHVHELREPESVRAWMHSIVRNEVRRLRRGKTAAEVSLQEAEAEPGGPVPSLLRLDIERALRSLPGNQAQALRLFYLDDLSMDEIARRTGHSKGTIGSWLHRGRRHLAAEMEEYAPMRRRKEAPTPVTEPSQTAAIVHTDLEPALVQRITEALQANGFGTQVIASGDLAKLPELLRDFQLIVLDEWIAGRPALELLLHMKAAARTVGIPVVLLCSNPSDFTVSAFWLAGIDRLVNKNNPDDLARLREVGREVVAIPEIMPVVPVRDKVYLPSMTFPLYVGREKTVRAIKEARTQNRHVLVVAQKQQAVDFPGPEDLYGLGTAARVVEVLSLLDGSLRVNLETRARARVVEYLQTDPFFQVRVEPLPEEEDRSPEAQALIQDFKVWLQQVPELKRFIDSHTFNRVLEMDEPGRLADTITPYLQLGVAAEQEILETLGARERLDKLNSRRDAIAQRLAELVAVAEKK